MQKGKVDLDKYLYAKDYLIEDTTNEFLGTEAICFVEGKKVIKIYFDPKEDKKIDLSKYKSDRIAFPKYYLERDNLRYGEVLPYFKGKTLERCLGAKSDIETFKFNYYEIIDEIIKYPNIWMNEINYFKNIIYLPINGFYLIDTTKWKEMKDNYISYNIKGINQAIINRLSKVIFDKSEFVLIFRELDNYYHCLKNSNYGIDFMKTIKGNLKENYRVIEFLEAYKDIIKAYYGYEIETIGDIKKYTKMMKNS